MYLIRINHLLRAWNTREEKTKQKQTWKKINLTRFKTIHKSKSKLLSEKIK